MTFGEAVRSGFDHYVKFDGRASRPAFWWWFLFGILVGTFSSTYVAAALLLYLPAPAGSVESNTAESNA